MLDEAPSIPPKRFSSFDAKVMLAFFLVCIAAAMVVLWILHPPSGDAVQIGLLSSFVTLFIKMAADAVGYQYNSSAGSEKKDVVQARVAEKLAEKSGPMIPELRSLSNGPVEPPAAGSVIFAWWSLLTDAEKGAISAAAPNDARVQEFVTTSAAGKAKPEDLEYLVSLGLLTQERAVAIQGT